MNKIEIYNSNCKLLYDEYNNLDENGKKMSYGKLAKKYDISKSTVYNYVKRQKKLERICL